MVGADILAISTLSPISAPLRDVVLEWKHTSQSITKKWNGS